MTGSVEFDSRRIGPGDLFVAVPGEHVDGHSFAADAVRAGAVGVLAAREVDAPAAVVPSVTDPALSPQWAPENYDAAAVLTGLAALAAHVASRLRQLTVIGVTGSAGKTSTKDLLAQLLQPSGPTVAPPRSFNNELGHPWTVLRANEATQHLVLELSARSVGEIAVLCRTVPPRIGAVLNVGSAHLGRFGSREAIARAKGELVEALPPAGRGGVAVLNADDPIVAGMVDRTGARCVLFGHSPDAHVRAADVALDAQARPRFMLVTPDGEAEVALRLHGANHIPNALAAATIAWELGVRVEEIAERLSTAERLSPSRMELSTRADGVMVINDAYNASPESVRAALGTLADIGGAAGSRRRWAVLGPMAELGEAGAAIHDEIGRLAVKLGLDRLIVVGEDARAIYEGACSEAAREGKSVLVPDLDTALAVLHEQLAAGDIVLFKAANAAGLWRAPAVLLAESLHTPGASTKKDEEISLHRCSVSHVGGHDTR